MRSIIREDREIVMEITSEQAAVLRFFVDDELNGFGTQYGYFFCRCGYSAKIPLDEDAADLWTYAHNRETHWTYEDPWTTGMFMGITWQTVMMCLPSGDRQE